MFQIFAAESLGLRSDLVFPQIPSRVIMRIKARSRAPTYPGFVGNELMLRVLIRGKHLLGQTRNARIFFTMSGSSISAVFKRRAAHV